MFGFFATPFYFILPLIIFVLVVRAAAGFFRGVTRRSYREFPDNLGLSRDLTQSDPRTLSRAKNSDEARIFKLAYRMKGILTVSDIVVDTGLNLHDAEQLIEGMVDNVHVRMEVDDRGMVIYEFPEIMRRFEDGNAST